MRGVLFFGLGVAAGAGALALALTADPPGRAASVPPGPAPGAPVSLDGSDDAVGDASTPALPIDGPVTPERAMEIVRAELTKAHGGGSYPGRFEHLSALGQPGIDALVEFASLLHPADGEPLAQLAIQALGDIPHARSLEVLEALAKRTRASMPDHVRDQIAHSLFRLGKPAMLDGIIAELEARERRSSQVPTGRPAPWPTPLSIDDLRRLAHRYLHAGRHAEAAEQFERLARSSLGEAGVARYNAACALSRGGQPEKALESLREAIDRDDGGRVPYADVEWMQVDGDLQAARRLPAFQYLVACCIARNRVDAGWRAADPKDVRAALDALARSGAAGYRIEHQDDRLRMFVLLRDHPEFESLWTAMGGAGE